MKFTFDTTTQTDYGKYRAQILVTSRYHQNRTFRFFQDFIDDDAATRYAVAMLNRFSKVETLADAIEIASFRDDIQDAFNIVALFTGHADWESVTESYQKLEQDFWQRTERSFRKKILINFAAQTLDMALDI